MRELTQTIIMLLIFIAIFFGISEIIKTQAESKYMTIKYCEMKIDSLDIEYNKRFREQHLQPMRVDTILMEQDTILTKILYYQAQIKNLLEAE